SGSRDAGFFNLPSALSETGISVWEDFSQELLESAKVCAEGVIADIKSGRIWPPAEKVMYDDFESLFPAAYEDCIDSTGFEEGIKL
ncbi:MAG: hypothetical protein P9M03_05435, partial [Candidatus Theseobacter exili]|nr:hypothetical protein [Candidatus Theseobacter exili]